MSSFQFRKTEELFINYDRGNLLKRLLYFQGTFNDYFQDSRFRHPNGSLARIVTKTTNE